MTAELSNMVVEVLHNRGDDNHPDWSVGSGFFIGSRLVLTALHNVDGQGELLVRVRGKEEHPAVVHLRGDENIVDLAVLEVSDVAVDVPLLRYGAVDRTVAAMVERCWAIGFPRFKERVHDPKPLRLSAQVNGEIPTGENLDQPLLTLQIRRSPRSLTGSAVRESEWAGMSGATVFSGNDIIVGVITEHHLPEGESALTVVPITAIDLLSEAEATKWWKLLGVNHQALVRLPGTDASLVINAYSVAPSAFSYRGIAGIPPPTEESTIQQRAPLVEAIYTRLTQPGVNALALTGIGGVGKSTLAALVSRYIEAPQSAGKAFFQAPTLWLSIDRAATIEDVIGTIFQRLGKPLTILDNLSPTGLVEAFFTVLDTLTLPRLIILDQFENLLDWATGNALPSQPGVGELIDAINSRPWKSNVRLLSTSRPVPKGTHEVPATCLHSYEVHGLTQQEGIALFRSQGIQAPEVQLQKAVTFCDGHPLSLVLLVALIQLYGLPISDLLADRTLWSGDIATKLLDTVFHRLTKEQRAVLRAFSVYRTAVPVAALTPFLTEASPQQILLSLRSPLVQQLIQPSGNECYQEHAVVAMYMQTHFVEGDQLANQQALRAAHARVAHYYLDHAQTTAPAREQRRRITDIQEIIEAVWHYTQAAQWQEAYSLLEQEDLLHALSSWGGTILLLDLCQWFLPQSEWQPEPGQAITIYLFLGRASSTLGDKQQALAYYQQALTICREVGDRGPEGTVLNNMGLVYDDLDNKQQALAYYQQALAICQQIGDRRVEDTTLNNIGLVYDALGDKQQALAYYQQALTICREVEDRGLEGTVLNNIGRVYDALGDKQQALAYYQQALAMCREVGDRGLEGTTLNNIGVVYDALGDKQQALAYYQQALTVCQDVGDRGLEGATLNNIGLVYDDLDNKQQALAYYQQALTICREVGDRGLEGTTLNNIGRVYDALGNKQQALAYLQQALAICREVGDRRVEDTTLNNIGRVYDALGNKQQALAYYQQALAICREVGDRGIEAMALNNIGRVYDALGNKQQALAYYRQALTVCQDVGDRRVEGTTQWNIGVLALGWQDYDLALAAFLLAEHCFEEISSPQQRQVEEWIAALHQHIGQKQFMSLRTLIEPQAQQFFEQALHEWYARSEEEEQNAR